jgi:SAM-dependent methyltransferase
VSEDEWYRVAFGELYPILYPHRDDAAASQEIISLLEVLRLEPKGVRALDLACGTGRHTEAMREAGFDVFGFDLSPFLLSKAQEHFQLRGRFVQGDIRNLPFEEEFDLVVNLFTSFGYFSDPENERAVNEMARILKPRGLLILDHINAEFLARTLVEEDQRKSGGFLIRQKRYISNRRVYKEITISGDVGVRSTIRENVRLYSPKEIEGLLKRASFQIVDVLGSFDGNPFDGDCERMIVVAMKTDADQSVA